MSKMKANDSRRGIGVFGSVPVYTLPLINSVNEMKALVGISSFQGVNDEAFPSLEKLAKRIGLSLAATSTAISGLVRKNIVSRKRNKWHNNSYQVLYQTESQDEIKENNKEQKRKERYERLQKNLEIHNEKINSFESLEYSKVSKVSDSNFSNAKRSNSSNDIIKEQLKEQSKRTEIETFHTKVISETLNETPKSNPLSTSRLMDIKSKLCVIAKKWNQTYIDSDRCNILYEQQRIKFDSSGYSISFDTYFDNALRMLEKLSTMPLDKFSPISAVVTIESLLKFNMQQIKTIETWYNKTYPKSHNVQVRPIKVEETLYDESRAGIVPSLEELQRMFADV